MVHLWYSGDCTLGTTLTIQQINGKLFLLIDSLGWTSNNLKKLMVMSFIIATMATTMLTIYPICSNLTSFKLSYALRIHETELIKLIHHYRKLQRLWVLTFNLTILSKNQYSFFIEMYDKFLWFMQILDCTGNKGVGVVVSTSMDFLDAVWPFQIFIVI